MASTLKSGRGAYRIALAAPPEEDGADLLLTIALERADGIERFALRCRVARPQEESTGGTEALLEAIGAQIERDFEQIREAALKSIRTERKLLELALS
jgi:hypothetical protein